MYTNVGCRLRWGMLATLMFTVVSEIAQADDGEAVAVTTDPSASLVDSPWLIAPVLSSSPKLGTTGGVLAGYLHYFDEKSRPSIFGVTGQYTTTDSIVAGAFAKTSFDEDRQRVLAGLAYGSIKNDYDDYLGTGIPLKNQADIKAAVGRYTYRVKGDWFVGGQGIYQDFAIGGASPFDDQVLDILGIEPYKSAGLGLVVQNDTRDDDNMPSRGRFFNFNNFVFSESLGGEDNYDVYRVELRYFFSHGQRNVFALRQLNHLTNDAPNAVRAPVQLRGYKVGQYTAEYMSSIEGEERFRLGERWTATLFGGVACLYGDGSSGGGDNCSDTDNLYPAAGAGVQFLLKPKEGIVLNLEYAQGEGDNYGVYLKMGYGF